MRCPFLTLKFFHAKMFLISKPYLLTALFLTGPTCRCCWHIHAWSCPYWQVHVTCGIRHSEWSKTILSHSHLKCSQRASKIVCCLSKFYVSLSGGEGHSRSLILERLSIAFTWNAKWWAAAACHKKHKNYRLLTRLSLWRCYLIPAANTYIL